MVLCHFGLFWGQLSFKKPYAQKPLLTTFNYLQYKTMVTELTFYDCTFTKILNQKDFVLMCFVILYTVEKTQTAAVV